MTRSSAAARLMPMPTEDVTAAKRWFSVHGAEDAPSRAQMVEGVSFEDAALGFVEQQHPQGDGDEIALLVEDYETGERQCFRIDLETGEAGSCA
ncbi:MAG: DUF5961 family protein [Phenylobacterium sp.]